MNWQLNVLSVVCVSLMGCTTSQPSDGRTAQSEPAQRTASVAGSSSVKPKGVVGSSQTSVDRMKQAYEVVPGTRTQIPSSAYAGETVHGFVPVGSEVALSTADAKRVAAAADGRFSIVIPATAKGEVTLFVYPPDVPRRSYRIKVMVRK